MFMLVFGSEDNIAETTYEDCKNDKRTIYNSDSIVILLFYLSAIIASPAKANTANLCC